MLNKIKSCKQNTFFVYSFYPFLNIQSQVILKYSKSELAYSVAGDHQYSS